MRVQNADAISEMGTGALRRRAGGLAPVPDDAPAPACRHAETLARLTTVAERITDLDLDGMLADISRLLGTTAALLLRDGTHLTGPPKTDAGVRVIALPELVVDELRKHLVAVPDDPEALVLGRPGNRSAKSRGSSPQASRRMASIDCLVSPVRCPKARPEWSA